jgi:hypothetical protein
VRHRPCCFCGGCYARRFFFRAEADVPLINLNAVAHALPHAWSSRVVERFGGGNFKVLRMDGTPYPDEAHDRMVTRQKVFSPAVLRWPVG